MGTTGFSVAYDAFKDFHGTSAIGTVLLHEYLGVSSGVLVFAVTLLAVGMFYGAALIERRVNSGLAEVGPVAGPRGPKDGASQGKDFFPKLQKGAA